MTRTRTQKKQFQRVHRASRVRAMISSGTAVRPRVSVFRSLRFLSVQVIDDQQSRTLVSCTTHGMPTAGTKTEMATQAGIQLANLMKQQGIDRIVFDRNGYRYHGRIKAFADALRAGGIQF